LGHFGLWTEVGVSGGGGGGFGIPMTLSMFDGGRRAQPGRRSCHLAESNLPFATGRPTDRRLAASGCRRLQRTDLV